jgi:hypothetical protein
MSGNAHLTRADMALLGALVLLGGALALVVMAGHEQHRARGALRAERAGLARQLDELDGRYRDLEKDVNGHRTFVAPEDGPAEVQMPVDGGPEWE